MTIRRAVCQNECMGRNLFRIYALRSNETLRVQDVTKYTVNDYNELEFDL
jgi:hypothetical protein